MTTQQVFTFSTVKHTARQKPCGFCHAVFASAVCFESGKGPRKEVSAARKQGKRTTLQRSSGRGTCVHVHSCACCRDPSSRHLQGA